MDKSFEGQLIIDGEFVSVKPSGNNDPYRYTTKDEAVSMVKNCYPDTTRLTTGLVRAKEVPFKANML